MDAWSSMPIPLAISEGRTALERRGAWFFRRNSAATAMRSTAGRAGAGRRSTRSLCGSREDQLIRQVIQGGGNMPAYGKNLSPAETTALVAFLETLHPAGQIHGRETGGPRRGKSALSDTCRPQKPDPSSK